MTTAESPLATCGVESEEAKVPTQAAAEGSLACLQQPGVKVARVAQTRKGSRP